MRFSRLLTLLLVFIASAAPVRADEEGQLFQDQVAKIFTARCLACHSDRDRKGGLSLSNADAAIAGGDNGAAFVPGKPDESLLVEHISGEKPEMPKGGPALSADEVAAITRWVAAGAKWPANIVLTPKEGAGVWWSLAPLVQPEVPRLESPFVRTPIDAFVLAKLNELGLSPSPEAGRRVLLRRVTFDLTGLPPTPEEAAEFLADQQTDAYERVVDRLLASPRYGERWGRYWLDIVHFGESHGYDKDKPRPNAWPYRDYVIRSLNDDKPYSRFVAEQLAGDVLFPDDPQATIATGFVAAGPWDFVGHMELREGTVDKAIARSNDRDDMLMAAMSTFTSMTVHCARCHDHKFDPITQQDYYRLQAVFAGVDRGDRPYRDAELQAARDKLAAEQQAATAELAELNRKRDALSSDELRQLDERIAAVEKQRTATPDPFATGDDTPASPTNGYHSEIAAKADVKKWVQVDLGESRPIELVRLMPARPTDFPDTPGFGFPLRYRVSISDDPAFATEVLIDDQTMADFPNPGDHPRVVRVDRLPARYVRVTAETLWPRTNDFVFALAEFQVESAGRNVAAGAAVTALDSIEGGRWGAKNLVDGFSSRRELPDLASPAIADAVHARETLERELQTLQADRRNVADALVPAELKDEIARSSSRVKDLDEQAESLAKDKQVYALKSIEPRAINLLRRGDVTSPGPAVGAGALSCVSVLNCDFGVDDTAGEGARRAALARWIVDPANMLTRRSIVNRVWQYHFGVGLVDTPGDFGRMGSLPSHPALLDWLAAEFYDSGESLKKLHKLIVTSSVYRQGSNNQPAAARIDAANRYLWRQDRRRLDAEAVRDAALAVSGKLDLTMGGPSVKQFFFKDDHSPIYDYAKFDVDDPAAWRRSVYRFIVRSVPDPLMECLDCADPSLLTPKRNTTLTSLQALAMLNNALFVRQAEHFADRVRATAGTPTEQIATAYRLALSREPTAEESRLLVDHANAYGLPGVCRLIFNMNEFVFVD